MADVFVSYARKNRERVGDIAGGLADSGYSLWWDTALKAGENYAVRIEKEIAGAGSVVVCWSDQAKESLWVRAEATEALDHDKLVQLRLDEARLPLPFNVVETIAFAGWNGSRQSPEWSALDGRVGRLNGRPLPEGVAVTAEPPPELKARLQGFGPVAALGIGMILATLAVAAATVLLGEEMIDLGLYRSLAFACFGAACLGAALIAWRFTRTALATRRR